MLKSIFDLCGANSQVNSELYLYDKKTGKQIKRLMPDYVGSIGSISGRKEHDRFFLSTCQFCRWFVCAMNLVPSLSRLVDEKRRYQIESALDRISISPPLNGTRGGLTCCTSFPTRR